MQCHLLAEEWNAHFRNVIRGILRGRVVPFLGAGVNLCERSAAATSKNRLPSAAELMEYLIRQFPQYAKATGDLKQVSQLIALDPGSGPLYAELHELLDNDYDPTDVHTMLASIPSILRSLGVSGRYPLILTTNYDDVLETAFKRKGETFDVITYVADGPKHGTFFHQAPDGDPRPIERPNEYRDVNVNRRSVILKMHGAVDRLRGDWDSYVITENHYIEYLTRTELAGLIPVGLAAHLRQCHFLFLGYSLRDWNLRVILHRIWGEQKLNYVSWAIQKDPSELDRRFWIHRGVQILERELGGYASVLHGRLRLQARKGEMSIG